MTEAVFWSSQPAVGRVAIALALSVLAHAAALTNAAFTTSVDNVALFANGLPLKARLMPDSSESTVVEASPASATQPPPDPTPAAQASASAAQDRPAAGLPSAPIYYPAKDLDERALPLNVVDVAYPESALADGVKGVVRLRLLIDHQGILREATVTGSQPAGTFDNAALDAVRALRFRPAIRNGVPVGSIKVIEVPFDPDCNRTGSCNN